MKKLFLISGEPSGDLQGSLLVSEIKKLSSDIEFQGLGGVLMKNCGVNIHYNLADEAVVGFTEVIKKINFFRKLFQETLAKIKEERPDAVIFIDYPGFNLRLVKEVKRAGIKTIYYISPQLWAWGEKRIKTIKDYVDEMIVFFKFEEEFYKKHNIKAKFIGHPLQDIVEPDLSRDEFNKKYNLKDNTKKIFIMPGSRDNEIKKHLPIILKAIRLIPAKDKLEFLLLKSPYVKKTILEKDILPLKIISDDNYNAIHHSDLGIVASGTATLESALLEKPYIIIYKTSLLNYLILKPQIKVPYIGIVNLILKEKTVPEFVQKDFNVKNISSEINKLLADTEYYSNIKTKLKNFKTALGQPGAAQRAAEYILNFLNK